MNDAARYNVLLVNNVSNYSDLAQQQHQQLASTHTNKANEDIIKEYFDSKQIEMKRVTLRDNPGGNAAEWDPDGAKTVFGISDPAQVDDTTSFVTIFVSGTVNPFCVVSGLDEDPGLFGISCSTAPLQGTRLDYIVTNLPPHVS